MITSKKSNRPASRKGRKDSPCEPVTIPKRNPRCCKVFSVFNKPRNQADSLIHAAEKTLSDLGDKATSEERMAVESAVSDLKSALEKDDKDAIEKKTAALAEASGGLAQRLYTEQQGAEGQADGGTADAGGSDDDVVDAEFEEVDKDDKKS